MHVLADADTSKLPDRVTNCNISPMVSSKGARDTWTEQDLALPELQGVCGADMCPQHQGGHLKDSP